MPKITTTGSAQTLYSSLHGTRSQPSRVVLRVDPESVDETVYFGRDLTVTAGTADATDGVPLVSGDIYSDELIFGESLCIIGAAGTDVYYQVLGSA